MAGIPSADGLIISRLCRTSGITGYGIGHAFNVLEHPLHAPETTAGKDRGFRARCRWRFVFYRRRDLYRRLGITQWPGNALQTESSGNQYRAPYAVFT
ncbi:hypothetical protein D3C76_1585280 [compost metagenome]